MSELPTGHNLTLNINGGCMQCKALKAELIDTIEEVDAMRIGCNRWRTLAKGLAEALQTGCDIGEALDDYYRAAQKEPKA